MRAESNAKGLQATFSQLLSRVMEITGVPRIAPSGGRQFSAALGLTLAEGTEPERGFFNTEYGKTGGCHKRVGRLVA